MAWFSKYKPCNDEKIHNAVKAGCEMSNRGIIGGYYAYDGETLVISLTKSVKTAIDDETYESVKSLIRKQLPMPIGGKAVFMESSEFNDKCPEKVKKSTGYVSMFTPELNKI